MRITTWASAIGVTTGAWTLALRYLDVVAYNCPNNGCVGLNPVWGTVAEALAVVLILDSLVGLVGPRRLYYSTSAIAVLLAGSAYLDSAFIDMTYLLATIGLAGATFVFGILAARSGTKVSEQSHPMNLPVFG